MGRARVDGEVIVPSVRPGFVREAAAVVAVSAVIVVGVVNGSEPRDRDVDDGVSRDADIGRLDVGRDRSRADIVRRDVDNSDCRVRGAGCGAGAGISSRGITGAITAGENNSLDVIGITVQVHHSKISAVPVGEQANTIASIIIKINQTDPVPDTAPVAEIKQDIIPILGGNNIPNRYSPPVRDIINTNQNGPVTSTVNKVASAASGISNLDIGDVVNIAAPGPGDDVVSIADASSPGVTGIRDGRDSGIEAAVTDEVGGGTAVEVIRRDGRNRGIETAVAEEGIGINIAAVTDDIAAPEGVTDEGIAVTSPESSDTIIAIAVIVASAIAVIVATR